MRNKTEIQNQIIQTVETVKKTNPMAASVTNTVTINFVANAQLAVGGSAAMCYVADECEFLAKVGGSFYINMGTIFPLYEDTLPKTAKVLYELNKAWVIDIVAVGIGEIRTKVLMQIKDYKPSIIRGNASEVITLAGLWGLTNQSDSMRAKGVDATDEVETAKDAAIALAKFTNGAVAVSGKTDLITDGDYIAYSQGGSHFMTKITGAGCSLGGVMAVYATAGDAFIAALTAHAVYNLAAVKATQTATGPASYQTNFIDELYKATAEQIANNPFELVEVKK